MSNPPQTNAPPLRAVGYRSVSMREQVEGYSIESRVVRALYALYATGKCADAARLDHIHDCPQPLVNALPIEKRIAALVCQRIEQTPLDKQRQQIERQAQQAQQRYERARSLYLAGELPAVDYENEKRRHEIAQKPCKKRGSYGNNTASVARTRRCLGATFAN